MNGSQNNFILILQNSGHIKLAILVWNIWNAWVTALSGFSQPEGYTVIFYATSTEKQLAAWIGLFSLV